MPEETNKQVLEWQVKGADRVEASTKNLAKQLVLVRREQERLQQEAKSLLRVENLSIKQQDRAVDVAQALVRAKRDRLDLERDLQRAINRTASEEQDAARASRDRAEQARLYGDVESRTRAITGAVGFIGGAGGTQIERTVNIGAEVLASVEAVGLLKEELPRMTENLIQSAGGVGRLTLGLGVAGAAIATGALVFDSLSDASKRAARNTQAWIDSLERFYDLDPVSKTTDEINEVIDGLIQDTQERGQKIADVERELRRKEGDRGFFEKAADFVGVFDDDVEKLRNELEELNKQQDEDLLVVARLTGAKQSDQVATNDLIAAEEELTELRRETSERLVGFIEERARLEESYAKRAAQFSSEQVERRQDEIDIERQREEAIQDQLAAQLDLNAITQEAYNDAFNASEDRLQLLDEEAGHLRRMLPIIEAREAEEEAIKEAEKALKERVKSLEDERAAMADRRAALEKFLQDSVKIEADRARELTEEQADFARKQIRDRVAFQQDLAKLDEQFYEKRGDLLDDITDIKDESQQERLDELKDFNKESQRAARDHYKELERIQRSAEDDIQSAAARLDAVAIREAQKRREQELDDAKDQYKTEKEEREEDFRDRLELLEREKRERLQDARDRLRDLEQQHNRERNERQRAFSEKQRQEEQDRQLTLQRQRAAWQREDAARREALASQLGITVNGLNAILSTTDAHWNAITQRFEGGFSTIVALVERELKRLSQSSLNAVQNAIVTSPYASQRLGGPQVPDFQNFGVMPRSGLARLERGEVALGNDLSGYVRETFGGSLSANTLGAAIARGVSGGNTYSISIPITSLGGDPAAIAQTVRREVELIFEDI